MPEKGDVQVPGGGNKKADPTSLGADKARTAAASNDAALDEGYTRSFLGPSPTPLTLGKSPSGRLGGGLLGPVLNRRSGMDSWNLGTRAAKTQQFFINRSKVAKTERLKATRDASGGGAKSETEPTEKNSASGRMERRRAFIGSFTPVVPTLGINATGTFIGPFKFSPLEWRGAFPILRLKSWNSISSAAHYINEEEEGR